MEQGNKDSTPGTRLLIVNVVDFGRLTITLYDLYAEIFSQEFSNLTVIPSELNACIVAQYSHLS